MDLKANENAHLLYFSLHCCLQLHIPCNSREAIFKTLEEDIVLAFSHTLNLLKYWQIRMFVMSVLGS